MNMIFEVYGDKQMNFRFGEIADSVKNFKPAFQEIQNDFYDVERKLFASEGGSGSSGQWKALVPWYAEWKQKQGRGETILVLSGNLYSSLVNKNDPNTIANINETSMELGTKNKLGKIHYTGTNKMPSRKPIDLNSKNKWDWLKIIQAHINAVVRGIPKP